MFQPNSYSSLYDIITGVCLLLNGTVYANNSIILIDEIGEVSGESSNGLQCVTDNRQCCQAGSQTGAWRLPSGELVPGQGHSTPFYVSRGNGTVVLNYDSGSGTTPTSGVFCCETPSANHVTETLCSILSEFPFKHWAECGWHSHIIVNYFHLHQFPHLLWKSKRVEVILLEALTFL